MPIGEIPVAGSRLSVIRERGLWTSGMVKPRLQKVVFPGGHVRRGGSGGRLGW